jgi:radical SAM-linked protein
MDAAQGNIREVCALRIRIKFRKYGVMKFIGHLDMMRYFQKCIRRAGIDIAYSEGFSPHQIMSFAAPLGVGATSDGEYLDIEVLSTKSSGQSLQALNETMAEGVEVVSYRRLKGSDKKAMSIVAAADYELYVKEGYEVPDVDYEAAVKEFYEKPDEILITKQTKNGEKAMDLKKLIYEFKVLRKEGKPVFYLKVCTGSTDNVKPQIVLEAFFGFLGAEYNPPAIQIHRKDVYGMEQGKIVSLGEMGEDIG